VICVNPGRVQLDAGGLPAGQGGAQERATDAGKRVQHMLPGLGKGANQIRAKFGRLLPPVAAPEFKLEGRRVSLVDDRAGGEDPLLAREVVQPVARMVDAPLSHVDMAGRQVLRFARRSQVNPPCSNKRQCNAM
jgi:hypothetical protein